MATFKVDLMWALVATVGMVFFGLQFRSSNRLCNELVAKLAAADVWQQQLNEEGDKLRREIRVLRHDIEDYRGRLDDESNSLSRSKKAEEKCKANIAKLESEQSRTDKAARDREDELEEQQQTLSQKLEKAESDFQMQQANLLNLQLQVNETSSNLSKAEEKVRQLLIACQDPSRKQGVNEAATATAVHNATAVTVPSRSENASTISATATAFATNVTTVAATAAATDVVLSTAADIAAKEYATKSVTLAESDIVNEASDPDGNDVVAEALDTSKHVTDAKDDVTKVVAAPRDDTETDGIETDDTQLMLPEEDGKREEGGEGDEGSEGQGR